jgi:SNF2 family DNA or RNA helicase
MSELQAQKNNLKYSKNLIKKYKKFDKYRRNHLSNTRDLKQKVVNEQVLNKYKTTKVEDALKPYAKNIKYSSLKYKGIRYLYDLKDYTQRYLMTFEGIGPKSAPKIIFARDRAFKDISKSHRLSFKPNKLSKLETKFLNKVAFIVENKQNFKFIDTFKQNELKKIRKLYRSIKSRKNIFFKLFYGKENLEKIDVLSDELESILKEKNVSNFDYLVEIFSRPYELSTKKISEMFSLNAPKFYAEIETLSDDKRELYTGIPKDLLKKIRSIELDTEHLKASLRQYQYFGAQFAIQQGKIIIGDEMGLGKTVQSIAVLTHLKAQGKNNFLVEVPTSVLYNWKFEIEKHSDLKPIIFHGQNIKTKIKQWETSGGVGIITYQSLVSNIAVLNRKIDALIIDEAHFIKNPKAQRTKASEEIIKKSELIIFLTGTPLENKVEEFVQLISYVDAPLSRKLKNTSVLSSPELFKNEIVSRYLRRNRSEVLQELPEIDQIEQWVEFDSSQELDYINALRQENFMLMRRIAWIAGDPAKSPKLLRLKDLHLEAIDNNRKMIVFSFFRDVIDIIYNEFKDFVYGPITGSMSSEKRQEVIQEFESAPNGSIILSQIEAGGVGLNIQAANTVVICEPQLKPSTELQAISRVYRMGQTRDVLVYRLLTSEGVDKYLLERLKSKQYVFENYAKESVLNQQFNDGESERKNLEKDFIKLETNRLQIS